MSDPRLSRLCELAAQLPDTLIADWMHTNHYELHSPGSKDDFFWLDLDDFGDYETKYGKRAGMLLDIAAELSRLKREGVL